MLIYFLSIILIFLSIIAISATNPINSIIALIFVYFFCSLLFILIGADLLAIILIIIYVGAISVLFLFVVMMLNLRLVIIRDTLIVYLPIGCFIGLLFFLEIIYIFLNCYSLEIYIPNNSYMSLYMGSQNIIEACWSFTTIILLGEILLNYYTIFIIIIALCLLLAMVGSIMLTFENQKHISYKYTSRKFYFLGNPYNIKKDILKI